MRTVLLLVLLLGLSACGQQADQAPAPASPRVEASTPPPTTTASPDAPTSSPTATATPSPSPSASPAVGDGAVTIEGLAFDPPQLTVPTGATVIWTNRDTSQHTVTAGAQGAETGAFDLVLDGQGSTASFTFDTPARYAYFCRIHPFMRAEITVEDSAANQAATAAPRLPEPA